MKYLLSICYAALIMAGTVATGSAQEVTLRLHHFMSERASLHRDVLVPLADRLAIASNGRIKLELFGSMSLGGTPRDLYDQAVDGAVDIVLTLSGYNVGRFPQAEVFELPFMVGDSIAASKAVWDLIGEHPYRSDFYEAHILSGWVHGPGVIHSKVPIRELKDLAGLELRGPTRLVTELIGELGAIPVGMPLPKIPESISRGVIAGAVVPWEIVPSIKLQELVGYHTEISGEKSLYTAVFVLAMNSNAYDDMPADLQAILDAETGKLLAEKAGRAMLLADVAGKASASGNTIITIGREAVANWMVAAQPVYEGWLAMAEREGFDGQRAIERARELINANR